jgi:hypothetical protein
MTKKEWKIYCPNCHTGAYFRFGFGSAILTSIALFPIMRWVVQMPAEVAVAACFLGFVPIGLLILLSSRLVEGSLERIQFDRRAQNSG